MENREWFSPSLPVQAHERNQWVGCFRTKPKVIEISESLKSHQRNRWRAGEHKHSPRGPGSPCPAGCYWLAGCSGQYLYRHFLALNISGGIYFWSLSEKHKWHLIQADMVFIFLETWHTSSDYFLKKGQKSLVDASALTCFLSVFSAWVVALLSILTAYVFALT